MHLAKDETIVKEWKYAKTRRRGELVENSLVVTNKRVISAAHGGLTNSQQEIALSDVCAVETGAERKSRTGAVVTFIFAALFLAAGIAMRLFHTTMPSLMSTSAFPMVMLLVAVFLGLIGWILWLKAGCKVEVKIFTSTIVTPMLYVSQNSLSKGQTFSTSVLRLKVDKAVAEEIVNGLGALLLTK